MSGARRILVTGATGKQGGALIKALLAFPPQQPFHLVALTRNAASRKAKALANKPNVSVLEGDFKDCNSIFSNSAPFYGIFGVQTPLPSHHVEEAEGKALVDAAAAHGVQHFVYTSAERGGPSRSDSDPTPVPHFQSKFNIEQHLRQVADKKGDMDWTIIRPVAFMDNLTKDFLGKAFATMWQMNGADRKMQLVSSEDIGILAADAFKFPEKYVSQAISFATDELTPTEANEIFKRVVGTDMPTTYHFVGGALKWVLNEQLGKMFTWMKEVGFGADPAKYRAQFPQMRDFETWLKQASDFRKR